MTTIQAVVDLPSFRINGVILCAFLAWLIEVAKLPVSAPPGLCLLVDPRSKAFSCDACQYPIFCTLWIALWANNQGAANLTNWHVLCLLPGRRAPGYLSIYLLSFSPADTKMMLLTFASSSTATASARPLKRRKFDGGKEKKYEPRALRIIRKDVMKGINPYSPLSTCTWS